MKQKLNKYILELGFHDEVHDVDKLTNDEFAGIRHNWFGASDSAKLLECHKYDTRGVQALIKDKIDNFHDPEIGKKAVVRCGADLEPFILRKAEHFFKKQIIKPTIMYVNKETGQSVNFDGVMMENKQFIPVEAKYASQFNKSYNFKLALSENVEHRDFPDEMRLEMNPKYLDKYIVNQAELYGIPAYYYTQLLQQMDFLNAPHGYLVVQNQADWTFYVFKVYRHELIISMLRRASTDAYQVVAIKKGLIELDDSDEDI